MNQLVAAFTITATLLLAQGCSSSVKSGKTPAATISPHSGHLMDGMEIPKMSSTAQAKLASSQVFTPNTPVPLVIDIQNSDGKVVTSFDRFQEKLMHLIVVSDNLQFFNHLHPTYEGSGRFEVKASFPQSGSYTLFSDYKPTGQKEQVSVLKTQVPGASLPPPAIDLSRTKVFANTEVNLTSSNPTLKAGQETTLTFDLREKFNNQPLADLQPYLGEKGHLVILRQSSTLTAADYIHAHAAKDTPASRVHFMTTFPQPGRYKLWGQFNRNGKIVVADFWMNVL